WGARSRLDRAWPGHSLFGYGQPTRRERELARLIGETPPSLVTKGVGVQTKTPDRLLATLNKLLDQAVRVVPRPRDNFASAVRAMQSGRYDAPPSRRYGTPSHRFRRLEAHELLARDITAAVDAGAPERESEFLKR